MFFKQSFSHHLLNFSMFLTMSHHTFVCLLYKFYFFTWIFSRLCFDLSVLLLSIQHISFDISLTLSIVLPLFHWLSYSLSSSLPLLLLSLSPLFVSSSIILRSDPSYCTLSLSFTHHVCISLFPLNTVSTIRVPYHVNI